MILIREAIETDAEAIRDIFLAVYGEDYSHPQFYDPHWIRKMVFCDDTLLLVAEDTETKQVLGTSSVLLEVGSHADLLGEFGRLAVHPDAQGRGIGKLLMNGRLERLDDRLHVSIVETRASHPFAQKISTKFGFIPCGLEPLKLLLKERESLCVYVRHFGTALELRKNNPLLIPEIYPLARAVLPTCSLPVDAVVAEEVAPYPHHDHFTLSDLTGSGYTTLLHFQRGRIKHREIFGPVRLHHGLFRIRSHQTQYLIAQEPNVTEENSANVAGAIGFSIDDVEKTLRIFELISIDEQPIYFLLTELVRTAPERWQTEYIEVDVSAHAPQMQQTLLELGFHPVAYIPAMVFHEVERLDCIRMAKITDLQRFREEKRDLVPENQAIADQVTEAFWINAKNSGKE